MDTAYIGLAMDLIVLMALAGTIYFVMRLSRALENFKAHREEMKKMVVELSVNIDQAQGAIADLKASSNTAADDLEEVLYDSRRMAEELKLINETSDSLATRLEGLVRNVRKPVEEVASGIQDMDEDFDGDDDEVGASKMDELPSFFIKDADFQNSDADNSDGDEGFASQAERELYDALQKGRKKSGGSA